MRTRSNIFIRQENSFQKSHFHRLYIPLTNLSVSTKRRWSLIAEEIVALKKSYN